MNKRLIWIADDDPIFRLIFRMTIKKVNGDITLVEFENGQLASDSFLEAIESQKDIPCCLFMDVNMPVMNGWDCLDKINDLYIDQNPTAMPKVFIMSSSINKEDEERIAHFPFATGYLRKPIALETFQQILGVDLLL